MPLQVNESHGILVLCDYQRCCALFQTPPTRLFPGPLWRIQCPPGLRTRSDSVLFSAHPSLVTPWTNVRIIDAVMYKEKRTYLRITLGTDVRIDGIVNMPARDLGTVNVLKTTYQWYCFTPWPWTNVRITPGTGVLVNDTVWHCTYWSTYYTGDKRYSLLYFHFTWQTYVSTVLHYTRKNLRVHSVTYYTMDTCILNLYDTRENVGT